MNNILAILLSGILASNVVVGNMAGIDISTNRLKSVKSASIYSLVIFCVLLASSLSVLLMEIILGYFGQPGLLFIVEIVIVAFFVQIAEIVTKKVAPRFHLEVGYFMPILACNLLLLVLTGNVINLSFVECLVFVLSNAVGIWLVLSLIAGVKQNHLNKTNPGDLKLTSIIVVLVLMVIWTAF